MSGDTNSHIVVTSDGNPWASFTPEEYDETRGRCRRVLLAAEKKGHIPLNEIECFDFFCGFDPAFAKGMRPRHGLRGIHTLLDALEAALEPTP